MVTFSRLGTHGRLGNQLFQIATTIAHADKMGVSYGFPRWEYSEYFGNLGSGCFEINSLVYNEPCFEYKDLPLIKDIDLFGYFQSYKYFDTISSKIKKILTPAVVAPQKDIVIHVRRGDYLNYPDHHPVLSPEYYKQALSQLPEGHVTVVSDSIEWCKCNIDANEYLQNSNEVIDLAYIVGAKHTIIANSTFSWWGAYLNNRGGKVIAPKQWFGQALKHSNTKDLIPNAWLTI